MGTRVTEDGSPYELAMLFADIGGRLAAYAGTAGAFEALTATAVRVVAGAEHAGISRGRRGRFETIAPTSDLPLRVDNIQYDLGSGPCVDAAVEKSVFRTGDLGRDPKWAEFGFRAAATTGVVSMLAVRLFLEDDDLVAAINMYSTTADAFDSHAQIVGVLLATHGGIAVAAAGSRERADNLETALLSNRDIGVAMGVLMNRHQLTREQAFGLLRVASQHGHRKLAEIAREVGDTGVLELPGVGERPGRSSEAKS
jgi:ANTAR domain/GAF domain